MRETHVRKSIHLIRAYAAANGWSAERYAKAAKIPPSTARGVLKGEGNPTSETLDAMESVIPRRWRPPADEHSRAA